MLVQNVIPMDLYNFTEIRHFLHQHPELSENETETTKFIASYLKSIGDFSLIFPKSEKGLIAIYTPKNYQKTIAIRCDIDAVPVNEINTMPYCSKYEGIAHKCGHDGHASLLLALAKLISDNPPVRYRIVLIFQPSEEIGKGAQMMIQLLEYNALEPDYIIGFHNLPGFPLHQIVIKERTFAAASVGLTIKLSGKQTHAAHPEEGINPANTVASLIQKFSNIYKSRYHNNFTQITPIGIHMGEKAFGTSAGYAELYFTLRTFSNHDMQVLKNELISITKKLCIESGLKLESEWEDEFPATVNNTAIPDSFFEIIENQNLSYIKLDQPFRWSEDFGVYLMRYPGIFFGIGSGIDCKPLHDPEYDFPDELINSIPLFLYQYLSDL